MKAFLIHRLALASAFALIGSASASAADVCPAVLNHPVELLTGGKPQSLCQYAGRVVLIVNTASECGYTGQYEGLQALHKKYAAKGLVVLGFPSNTFGGQEPGGNKKIAEFCQANYGVTFPVFGKIEANPLTKDPVFAGLAAASGAAPRWNFHKYLIDRSGKRVESFESAVEPQSAKLTQKIEALLAQSRER
ncbi:MAG: glutathione peroxidase [Casimicrobium sp.]